MTPFSILDLAPIVEGGSAAQAFRNSLDLAQHAERWGYHRYWLAEHHNMPAVASAATAVVIAHVAAGTSTIRVGAGGIMLPNHAPLVIAEQFGTLEALFPGRVDLGVGRAPGSDQITALALRRAPNVDSFPQDVQELIAFSGEPAPGQRVKAVPGAGSQVRSGSLARACMLPSWPPIWACRSLSHHTSRPHSCCRRWRSSARGSSRHRSRENRSNIRT